jgi:hypothetical protein
MIVMSDKKDVIYFLESRTVKKAVPVFHFVGRFSTWPSLLLAARTRCGSGMPEIHRIKEGVWERHFVGSWERAKAADIKRIRQHEQGKLFRGGEDVE